MSLELRQPGIAVKVLKVCVQKTAVKVGSRSCEWSFRKAQSRVPLSHLHDCNLNWKELVLHLVVSQSSMVRSVKLTFPSASIKIIVLVLVP